MSKKIAGASSLLVFAICLIFGLMADNTMSTILSRSLLAMAATLVIGMIIGAMAEKMMLEHHHLLRSRRAAEQTAADGAAQDAEEPIVLSSNIPTASRRQNASAGRSAATGASKRLTSRLASDKQKK